ncbi:MAG: hemerythrin family protein [Pseudomonadota bacterium]
MSLKAPKRSQKVSLAIAYLCYIAALLSLLTAIYRGTTLGTEDPIFASLVASVVFFIGCGIVLHVIGAVDLPDLKIDQNKRK